MRPNWAYEGLRNIQDLMTHTSAGPSSLQTRFLLLMIFLETRCCVWAQHPDSTPGALDVAHGQHPADALEQWSPTFLAAGTAAPMRI